MTNENHEPDVTDGLAPESNEAELKITAEVEQEDAAQAELEDAAEEELAAEEAEEEDEAEEEAEIEAETEVEAEDGPEPESEDDSEDDDEDAEADKKPRPPAKLERLQKILAKAGVASRRRAEELIEQGRVQINGKTITELGTKADAGRDHIRVDGKLLQGAERIRYFVLNKPRGFVTTVKDPEGRPTVMQFFEKMKERLYPVGRLDYMSEGLLLVTNDGELANRLTKASSGVEKTYLVKVAGQPTEDELDVLRGGVSIERGKPGTSRVKTSPARIRQVRQGDNPWYEVVLIEGRNRELRKMFEEVGHFVEKIRRIGYGPLVLDQEPGNLRELEPDELTALRLAAEGKKKTPKSKEVRRRDRADAAQLPTVAPKPSRPKPAQPFVERPAEGEATPEIRPRKTFGAAPGKPFRVAGERNDARPRRTGAAPGKFGSARPTARPSTRPDARGEERPAARPAWKKDDRPARPSPRFAAGAGGEERPAGKSYPDKPSAGRTYGAKPSAGKTFGSRPTGRPSGDKPAWKKPEGQQWPAYKRPPVGRPPAPRRDDDDFDDPPRKPSILHIEAVSPDERPSRPSTPRPYVDRPRPSSSEGDRSSSRGPGSSRPSSNRPSSGRSGTGRTGSDRPYTGRSSSTRPPAPASGEAKPFRGEGGLARPFTTSSGKPRAGGARPSSKPGKPAGRSYGAGSGSRSGSAPRSGSDSRPSYGAKRSYDSKPGGPPKRSFRREEGEGSFKPRPARPAAPRSEPVSDYRPTKAKPFSPSTSRADRKTGTGWKPKPSFGGKPASGSRSKPKSGGFSKPGGAAKSGFKGKSSGPKRTGGKPGGKKRG